MQPDRFKFARVSFTRLAFAALLAVARLSPAAPVAPPPPAKDPTDQPHHFGGPSLPMEAPRRLDPPDSLRGYPVAGLGLKIGYLAEGSDFEPPRALIAKLRETLLASEPLRGAMKEFGFGEIEILPRVCDGPEDMIQRLGADEFELAFATSIVYANQLKRRIDAPESLSIRYEPILQFRLENDIHNPRETGVWRKAKVFAGPSSELWSVPPTDAAIRRELESSEFAVSDFYSAAGYIFPTIEIWTRFGIRPRNPLFCRSSSEVAKHVISGLSPIGACESRIVEKLGAPGEGSSKRLYKELFETGRIPSDPILLRSDLMPQYSSARLGSELKIALKAFFNASPQPAAGLWVEDAERRSYEDIARALRQLDSADPGAANQPAAASKSSSVPADPAPAEPARSTP